MRLSNDSPSFIPVHSQIRAIGPRDLHLWKGRGQREGDDFIRNTLLGALQRRAPEDLGPDFLRAQPIEDIGPVMRVPHRFQHCL